MYGHVNAYSSISYAINGLTFTLFYYLVTVFFLINLTPIQANITFLKTVIRDRLVITHDNIFL